MYLIVFFNNIKTIYYYILEYVLYLFPLEKKIIYSILIELIIIKILKFSYVNFVLLLNKVYMITN